MKKKKLEDREEFNKKTTINIQWVKKRNMRGAQWEVEGDKLPKEILRMIAQDMLQELKIPIRIEQ